MAALLWFMATLFLFKILLRLPIFDINIWLSLNFDLLILLLILLFIRIIWIGVPLDCSNRWPGN